MPQWWARDYAPGSPMAEREELLRLAADIVYALPVTMPCQRISYPSLFSRCSAHWRPCSRKPRCVGTSKISPSAQGSAPVTLAEFLQTVWKRPLQLGSAMCRRYALPIKL